MREQRQWYDEDVDKVRRLIGEGRTVAQIAELLSRSPGSIKGCMSHHKIRMPNYTQGKRASEDDIRVIRQMVSEGSSTKEIGERLGRTRSSVIGIMHRNGIKSIYGPRRSKPPADPMRPTKFRTKPTKQTTPNIEIREKHVEPVEDFVVPEEERRGLVDRLDTQCCFPIGDPRSPGFHYCHHERIPGQQYCAHHMAVMYGKRKAQKMTGEKGETEPSSDQQCEVMV